MKYKEAVLKICGINKLFGITRLIMVLSEIDTNRGRALCLKEIKTEIKVGRWNETHSETDRLMLMRGVKLLEKNIKFLVPFAVDKFKDGSYSAIWLIRLYFSIRVNGAEWFEQNEWRYKSTIKHHLRICRARDNIYSDLIKTVSCFITTMIFDSYVSFK